MKVNFDCIYRFFNLIYTIFIIIALDFDKHLMNSFFPLSATGISLDPIYKCLNRTILFQLSRPIDSLASQASVLDALHLLTNNRNLIFGPGNHDNEFLGCLCYCLLQLTEDPESRYESYTYL